MLSKIKKCCRILLFSPHRILPHPLMIRTDPELFSIERFVRFASKQVRPSDRVLDAGAGACKYREYFSHAKYESTDFDDIFDKSSKHKHDFICSLDSIPKPANSYDVIINTQVLEHVKYPQKVIKEFYRVLKPGGRLFLTAPLGDRVHGAPYNFFSFTNYGLELLFREAGFDIRFIKPRGGVFWYLGKRIKLFPSYIMQQYLYKKTKQYSLKFKFQPLAILLLPFYLLSLPFCDFLIPFIFLYLDGIDKHKDYTLGYACYCVKRKG